MVEECLTFHLQYCSYHYDMEVMAEDCGDLAATFDIPAMPTVLLFADGEVSKIGCST